MPILPDRLTTADKLTWHNSDPEGDDRRWRITLFYKVPEQFHRALAVTYNKLYEKEGRTKANTYLRIFSNRFEHINTMLATDDDFASDYADKLSRRLRRITIANRSPEDIYTSMYKICRGLGIKPPKLSDKVSLQGALQRMSSSQWLKRALVKRHQEEFETATIAAGMVHKFAGIYVSDCSYKAFVARKARNRRILHSVELENEQGHCMPLHQLVESSVANPVNRRNELMARLDGFDRNAKQSDHIGLFVTLTCPSRMHARYKKSGDPNPNYDGTSPNKSQQYLCKLWSRIRSNLKHAGISVYGFRVAEPQHDGTPHWHVLLYAEPEYQQSVRDIFLKAALEDSPDENGARKRRCVFKIIDRSKGTGVGYIAKYISKNIDGTHIDKDKNNIDGESSASRVTAWASIHRIRQFQQFGGPTVTCWREMRKAKVSVSGVIEEARTAADQGDWLRYTQVQGGTSANRKTHPVKPLTIYDDEPGKYGEPKGYRIEGVTDGKLNLVTKLHQWIVKLQSEGSGVAGSAGRH